MEAQITLVTELTGLDALGTCFGLTISAGALMRLAHVRFSEAKAWIALSTLSSFSAAIRTIGITSRISIFAGTGRLPRAMRRTFLLEK